MAFINSAPSEIEITSNMMDGRVTTKKENDCNNTEDTTMPKQSDDDNNIGNSNNNITAFFTHLLDNKNMGSMLSKIDVVIVSDNAKSRVNNSIPQNVCFQF